MEKNALLNPEPLKSIQISAGTRVYYLDLHKDSKGARYIVISEIPTTGTDRTRRKIYLFEEQVEEFVEGLRQMAEAIKEA